MLICIGGDMVLYCFNLFLSVFLFYYLLMAHKGIYPYITDIYPKYVRIS